MIEILKPQLLPPLYRQSCCVSYPFIILLTGVITELIVGQWQWGIRALVLLGIMLITAHALWTDGVKDKAVYVENKQNIWIVIAQTLFYSLFLYIVILSMLEPFVVKLVATFDYPKISF